MSYVAQRQSTRKTVMGLAYSPIAVLSGGRLAKSFHFPFTVSSGKWGWIRQADPLKQPSPQTDPLCGVREHHD